MIEEKKIQSLSEIRIGIIGCGWAGRQAAMTFKVMPNVTITGIADPHDKNRESFAKEYQVEKSYENYKQLLSEVEIDAVYIATNPDVRFPIVMETLALGKHALVQKPHAMCAEEILDMEKLAIKNNCILMFSYYMHHYPQNRLKKYQIENGTIGAPYHARVFVQYDNLVPLNEATRWQHVYGMKGGPLGNFCSHESNLAWWLMGCPKPEWAFGVKHSPYALYDGIEGAAEDYFSGLVGFEGGKTLQIDCTRKIHVKSQKLIEIYGTEGAMTDGVWRSKDGNYIKDAEAELVSLGVHESSRPHGLEGCWLFFETEYFINVLRGKSKPEVDAKEAYIFMKIIDALYESARTNKKIDIYF